MFSESSNFHKFGLRINQQKVEILFGNIGIKPKIAFTFWALEVAGSRPVFDP